MNLTVNLQIRADPGSVSKQNGSQGLISSLLCLDFLMKNGGLLEITFAIP